jgi:HAD superfamily hydrolase (TIGR01509 family)
LDVPEREHSPLQAVLFDVDGTLVDSFPMCIPGLADTYEHFTGNRPSDETLRSIMGIPLKVQMRLFQETEPDEETVERMIAYALERYDVYAHRERLFDGAVDALRILHRAGIKTALVTSKNATEVASFLSRFSARDAVDTTVCASDVVHPKPHAESAILACSRLGVSPDRAAFVGDSVFDLQCAHAAGIATSVAVTYGGGTETALRAEQPSRVFPTPEVLREWAQNEVATLCLDART